LTQRSWTAIKTEVSSADETAETVRGKAISKATEKDGTKTPPKGRKRTESNEDGGDVDGDLELEELLDGIVDTSSPHDSEHDRREVVVHLREKRRRGQRAEREEECGEADERG